jgi:hypothetical protein
MMLKLGISTLQNDDLTRKDGKLKGVLATLRVSSVWQYMTCHTLTLLARPDFS